MRVFITSSSKSLLKINSHPLLLDFLSNSSTSLHSCTSIRLSFCPGRKSLLSGPSSLVLELRLVLLHRPDQRTLLTNPGSIQVEDDRNRYAHCFQQAKHCSCPVWSECSIH